jgi:hypothetical protein
MGMMTEAAKRLADSVRCCAGHSQALKVFPYLLADPVGWSQKLQEIPMHVPMAANDSQDILAIANNPVLWVCVAGVFGVIVVQSLIFLRAVRKAAPAVQMSPADIRTSFRSGAVSAIGPSLAVALVAIALLALFGAPAVLSRIGLIGSAAYDVSAAGIAAGTMGAKLGDASYTQSVFAVAFFAMSIGGAMWMLATLILTPLLRRGDAKVRAVNPAVMAIVPAAALLGAFACLGFTELPKSATHVVTFAVSAAIMGFCLWLAKATGKGWLREWGLGISIVAALVAAFIAAGK